MLDDLNDFIFSSELPFAEKAIKIFRFQYQNNLIYKRFADSLNCHSSSIKDIEQIPFLPISFFKSHQITTGRFAPHLIFESSGTTGNTTSKHFVNDIGLYETSFRKGWKQFYGDIEDYCILGLVPSYLERENSSLVYMVNKMMEISRHPLNAFHLYNHAALANKLMHLEKQKQKTLLIGVTYALLDFANQFPLALKYTIVMETGGMKGRKKEMIRPEVHQLLKEAFKTQQIHSEYGMTELLSQAYSLQDGIFKTPPWMKVLVRPEDDPMTASMAVSTPIVGAVNVIDLANVHSCSFIATDDLGKLNANGSFEILGRMDNSDIRGCSLMAL